MNAGEGEIEGLYKKCVLSTFAEGITPRTLPRPHPLGLSNQAEKYLFTSQFILFSASLGGWGGGGTVESILVIYVGINKRK